jgi:hypothetical protein
MQNRTVTQAPYEVELARRIAAGAHEAKRPARYAIRA